MMNFDKLPITVLIMTQNEEENIKFAIDSVINDFDQVIVTDSYSTDKTVEICKQYPPVKIYQNIFEGWAEQRNWMIANCEIRNEIIFFLDADEYITNEFLNELSDIIHSGRDFSAIYLKVAFMFLGKHLKYSYGHPRIRRIFKRTGLYFTGEGAREYAHVTGAEIEMKNYLMHHDRRLIGWWIDKHNRNADREAKLIIDKVVKNDSFEIRTLPIQLKTKLWIRRNIWDPLPSLFRPFLYFIYRYIIQLGFLDGKAGLIYCYLHAFWYQSLIAIKVIENQEKKEFNR